MSFRPRNYQQALEFLNDRRDKRKTTRTISTRQEGGGGNPVEVRDQLVAHTDDPSSTYGPNPPPVSFRQWGTDIATFYPAGKVAIRPWNSVSSNARMDEMCLPCVRSTASMGVTKNQTARLREGDTRVEMKGFPHGVPASANTYLLDECRELAASEDEPVELVYMEAAPGVHATYNLGRRRLLKVLKQYHDMVVAIGAATPLRIFALMGPSIEVLGGMCLSGMSAQQMRDEWLPSVLHNTTPAITAAYYDAAKQQLGLYDLTSDSRLWTTKVVKSRELDQWL